MKKKLLLPDVTLLAATSIEIDQTQISLKISSQKIQFGAIKLLSPSVPKIKYSDVEYVSIPPISLSDYNRMMIEDLHKHFETSHCLIVQADSFVVNPDLWTKEFMNFDYIGAPWSNTIQVNPDVVLNLEQNPVGNGGFSLRSRKLVEKTASINFKSLNFPIENEDVIICHYLYKEMSDSGIRFAPPQLAAKFSLEDVNNQYGQKANNVFGFHGKHLRNYFLKKHTLRSSFEE